MNDQDVKKYIEQALDASERRHNDRYANWQKDQDVKYEKREKENKKIHEEWEKDSDERMERYMGVAFEQMDDKMKAIKEITEPLADLPERFTKLEEKVETMSDKLDATFEQAGRITEDMVVLKETLARHEIALRQR